MSRPWWGQDAARRKWRSPLVVERGVARPRPFSVDRRQIADEIRTRIRAYTPEWTSHRRGDAGEALIDLFGAQAELVTKLVDQLPVKATVELLRSAGVGPLPPRPPAATLALTVSPAAAGSVLVPAGLQVGGAGPDGLVLFETERSVVAAPTAITELQREQADLVERLDPPEPGKPAAFLPFGARPAPGTSLYLGLADGPPPGPQLAIGFFATTRGGVPPPAAAGGLLPVADLVPPAVAWEVFDGTQFVAAEVLRDETVSFTRSGVVELRVPRRWEARTPPGLESDAPRRWVRVTLLFGNYEEPPSVDFVVLNAVPALAGETVRDEVLEPADDDEEGVRRRLRLRRTPVLASSLVLDVDEGAAEAIRWLEVDDLSQAGPDDRVYALDPSAAVVEFGDGVHGRPLPEGFRHVVARRYRVPPRVPRTPEGVPRPLDLGPDTITTLVSAAPFVVGVTNPRAASGGVDDESSDATLRRGPREIRTRGRAVTPSDFELMALRAPGADVRRAHAVPGFHPEHAGRPIPGVVGLLVVPPDPRDGHPPVPDERTLQRVVRYLAAHAAPAGVEVVATAPRFHRVRVEMAAVPVADRDLGEVLARVVDQINHYLHPLGGGDDEDGWPFGGTIRWVPLVRTLLNRLRDFVTAIPRLNLVVDGVRSLDCRDRPTSPHALLWPDAHEVVLLVEEAP
jgi:predicted phage baseplate assembly protein